MAKPTAAAPAEKVALYEKLVATHPKAELKGATMPYTSLNGHMFSMLAKDGTFALRLPKEQREAFLAKHETVLCEQHGRILDEYVVVPDALLRKTSVLAKHFAASYAYVESLKPKATTRPKKAARVKER